MISAISQSVSANAARALKNPSLVWVVVFLIFGEGLAVSLSYDGSCRLLPLAAFVTLGVLFAEWRLQEKPLPTRAELRLLLIPGVYLGLGILLPIIGVVLGAPTHYLAAVTHPVSIGAWVLIGILVARRYPRAHRAVGTGVAVATAVQFGAGVMQMVLRNFGVRDLVWLWGKRLELLFDATLLSRASGFYLNPNTYSFFGLLALIWSMYAPGPKNRRFATAIMALGIIFLGASRSSMGIAAVVVLAWALSSSQRVRLILGSRRRVIALVVAAVALVLIVLTTSFGVRFQERFVSTVAILFHGPGADPNVEARMQGWSGTIAYLNEHPVGTLVPPFSAVRVVDGDYLRCLAQGSAIYLLAYLMMLVGAIRLALRPPLSQLMLWTSLAVATTGLSQSSSETVPAVLFWMALGMLIVRSAAADTTDAPADEPSQAPCLSPEPPLQRQ